LGGAGMSKSNRYKWLIVVEGDTDVETYSNLLTHYGVSANTFSLFSAQGKGFVCNANTWGDRYYNKVDLLNTIIQDSGRKEFTGVILIIDSDIDNNKAFDNYRRSTDPRLRYVNAVAPSKENKGTYWYLDSINGVQNIPIYGIVVPMASSGCLETDLLNAYGFPVEGQDEYTQLVEIIQKSSIEWQIPKHGDGKDWWIENRKAKLDKFVYSALSYGFKVSGETPRLPNEPIVISNIKSAFDKAAIGQTIL
jgi:hypothetical protein